MFPSSDPNLKSIKTAFYSKTCFAKLVMLAKLNLNGRKHQFFPKWKTTSIFPQKEDDLNFQMKDPLYSSFSNQRRPQLYFTWKTTSILVKWKMTSQFFLMEDDLIFFNKRLTQIIWKPFLCKYFKLKE